MDLGRDLLDNLVVDRRGDHLGRVDGIVIDLRPGRAPRVAALEVGGAAPARRVHWVLEFVVRRVMGWMGVDPDPARIPVDAIRDVDIDVVVDLDADTRHQVLKTERWLAAHVVRRLPGGKR